MLVSEWTLIRWLHLLSAIAWIGGQVFILLVLLPVLRTVVPREDRTLLFARVGRRYGIISWIALALLVITGVLNGERRSLRWSHLLDSDYGQILAWKLGFVAVVVIITGIHAFYFGRRLTILAERRKALDADDPTLVRERRRLQAISGVLSGLNLLLNLLIVWLAAALVA